MDIRKRLEELKIGEKLKKAKIDEKLEDTIIGQKLKDSKLAEIDLEKVKWEDVILVASGVSMATVSALSLVRRVIRMTKPDNKHGLFYLVPPVAGIVAGGMLASLPMREDASKAEVEGELFTDSEVKEGEENISEVLNDTTEKSGEEKKEVRDVPVDTETNIDNFSIQ